MTVDVEYAALEERFDGLAWSVMALICDLEKREQIDGARFCQSLRRVAAGRRQEAGLEIAAATMEQLAERLDEARSVRRRAARQRPARTR